MLSDLLVRWVCCLVTTHHIQDTRTRCFFAWNKLTKIQRLLYYIRGLKQFVFCISLFDFVSDVWLLLWSQNYVTFVKRKRVAIQGYLDTQVWGGNHSDNIDKAMLGMWNAGSIKCGIEEAHGSMSSSSELTFVWWLHHEINSIKIWSSLDLACYFLSNQL